MFSHIRFALLPIALGLVGVSLIAQADDAAPSAGTAYIMMDHSKGDAKAMQRMTNKTVPIKHMEGTGGLDAGASPNTGN